MPLCLLDTDMLSEVLRQKYATVRRKANRYLRQYNQFAFSAFTRYEVLRGMKQKQATRQLLRFEAFCTRSLIFAVSDAVLDRAADLWAAAYRGGHPRNDGDLIIGATALEEGRQLVTGNTAHFAWIPGLTIENWRQP
jgi:tRNA(fMet)-specific endonuclease VapC